MRLRYGKKENYEPQIGVLGGLKWVEIDYRLPQNIFSGACLYVTTDICKTDL